MELADIEKAFLMAWVHLVSKIPWRGLSYGKILNWLVHLESSIDSESRARWQTKLAVPSHWRRWAEAGYAVLSVESNQ